ncbi:MAG TPA: glycosyltransferase family 4 protein [Acidimicrobiia bacterium]|jgi:glycosyltransferase involved in cell wall biosynthesis|nr:glycosyltransferase family 4 protein [Acidimicrobiia bacterium]
MTAIHQFVPTLAPRDAVGLHYLAVQSTLRDAGYRSDIYAYEAKDEYARRAEPFQSFAESANGEPTWLLYHSSIGSPVADFVARRDEPLIVDYHNVTPASFFARWEPALAAMLMKGRRQLADLETRAALGIADSAFNAEELTRLGYARTSVVPILLDIAALERTPPNPAIGKPAATTWLFVGRIAPNKAQHDIVKAFAAYRRLYDPEARLRLVGGSSSHTYECALHDFIGALELRDAIEVTGAVDDATLMAYYDTSDVFVVLSEHEGFCVPLLEAMFHDLPIVAYASSAIPGTVGDAGLLLQQKDAYTVAEAVARVSSDSTLRAQLVAAGKARLPEFDVARSRQKLLDAIVPVVGAAR